MNAISLENVSKRFVLSKRNRRPLYRELVHLIKREVTPKASTALSNITLEIEEGMNVGVIGPNGAGKSTLLRVISGIYRPSKGKCMINGQLACVFESSASMSPTLSVLDNVFLIGAIVGLSYAETKKYADEILDFAELEDLRYARVEHLSFGMQQRIIFSLILQIMKLRKAAIFLFDEWLAGADYRFQEKSQRMTEVSRHERQTMVYTSHDLKRIERLCEKTVYLKEGRIMAFGKTPEVIEAYLDEYGGML